MGQKLHIHLFLIHQLIQVQNVAGTIRFLIKSSAAYNTSDLPQETLDPVIHQLT